MNYSLLSVKKRMRRIGGLLRFKPAPSKIRFGFGATVNKSSSGILAWVIGDRYPQTFLPLWKQIKTWNSFWYVTDGYPVYRCFINDIDHLISKTYMTRVEGENTRLRHYLARLHRRTLCYSKSIEMLKFSLKLLLHYLKYKTVPI